MQQHHITLTFTLIGILSTVLLFSRLNAIEQYAYGSSIFFGHIFFEQDSDEIFTESLFDSDLSNIGSTLTLPQYAKDLIFIVYDEDSETDRSKPAFSNHLLSKKRAESVKRHLVQHFPLLAERRLIVRGSGHFHPFASNDTPKGRSQQKVVVIFLHEHETSTPLRGGLGKPIEPPSIAGTGLAYLVGNQPEDQGYGLYSYLLFAFPPTPATRDRYQAAITAYLACLSPMRVVEKYLERHQLNITYLPLLVRPLPERIPPDAFTEWILEHYNYTRARLLLNTLQGDYSEGPYIVSSRMPLPVGGIRAEPYLYQDLSWVPPPLIELWLQAFLHQAMQERFWQERTAKRWVLHLRTAIAMLAESLPEVQKTSAEVPKKTWDVHKELPHRIVGNR